MISMPNARRRADEFNAAVESGRAADPAVQSLVAVAQALRVAEPVTPRPEFAASLRERLMTEAETSLSRQAALTLPARRTRTRERRLAAAASAFVLLGGTAGVAAAAQGSLPGDMLYPIKRGIERAQADLNTSNSGKGSYLLEQASGRLDEVRGLLDEKSTGQVPGTIADFTTQSREGTGLLFQAFNQTRDPQIIVTIREFAAQGLSTLQQLAQDAPPSAQPELAAAAVAMRDIDAEASSLCSSCAPTLPALELPPMFLASADASSTIADITNHPTTLDNSHPLDSKLLKKVQKAAEDTSQQDPQAPPAPDTSTSGGSPSVGLPTDNPLDPSSGSGSGSGGDLVTDMLTQLSDTGSTLLSGGSTDTSSSGSSLLP